LTRYDNADAAGSPYTIEVSARDQDNFVNDPAIVISFTLTVTAYPVALSFSAINNMEYLVGNSAVTQTLQPCTTDYLGPTSITHSMRLTDLTPFPTHGMSFSSSTLTVSVQTIDQNNDGLY